MADAAAPWPWCTALTRKKRTLERYAACHAIPPAHPTPCPATRSRARNSTAERSAASGGCRSAAAPIPRGTLAASRATRDRSRIPVMRNPLSTKNTRTPMPPRCMYWRDGTVEMVAQDQRDGERPKAVQLGHVAQRGGGRPDRLAAAHAAPTFHPSGTPDILLWLDGAAVWRDRGDVRECVVSAAARRSTACE